MQYFRACFGFTEEAVETELVSSEPSVEDSGRSLFPDEMTNGVLVRIMTFLDVTCVAKLGLTNSLFQQLISCDEFDVYWRMRCEHHVGPMGLVGHFLLPKNPSVISSRAVCCNALNASASLRRQTARTILPVFKVLLCHTPQDREAAVSVLSCFPEFREFRTDPRVFASGFVTTHRIQLRDGAGAGVSVQLEVNYPGESALELPAVCIVCIPPECTDDESTVDYVYRHFDNQLRLVRESSVLLVQPSWNHGLDDDQGPATAERLPWRILSGTSLLCIRVSPADERHAEFLHKMISFSVLYRQQIRLLNCGIECSVS
eukprot:ANDGO_05517.mRNA.1 hypothetical protein